MFNRRTLATLTAVAALVGGSAGAITSSITTPEGAHAAGLPMININPGTPPDDRLGSTFARKTIPDSTKIAAIWQGVAKLNQAQERMDARLAAIEARSTALDARTAETKEMIDGLTAMTSRSASGRSLINLVDDILGKSRLICADVVGDVLPIAPDRHVTACD
jgi:hypothetical protein